MLRIYMRQDLYNLSDMKVMTKVIDSRAFLKFYGVNSSNQIPGGDNIGRFRNILVKNCIQKTVFAGCRNIEIKKFDSEKGTIVDSTIITVPTSTQNKGKARHTSAFYEER